MYEPYSPFSDLDCLLLEMPGSHTRKYEPGFQQTLEFLKKYSDKKMLKHVQDKHYRPILFTRNIKK